MVDEIVSNILNDWVWIVLIFLILAVVLNTGSNVLHKGGDALNKGSASFVILAILTIIVYGAIKISI